MKKKILGVFVILFVVAIMEAPVYAVPTQGQKSAITITFALIGAGGPPAITTGNVIHRSFTLMWTVELKIDGQTLLGIATHERKLLRVHKVDGREFRILNDYCVLDFGIVGTFEGHALLETDRSPTGDPADTYTKLCRALLQGTGDFEGHTINAKQDWTAQDQTSEWSGYLLKPLP